MFDEIFSAILAGIVTLFEAIWEGLSTVFEWLAEGFTALVQGIAGLFMQDAAGIGVGIIFVVFFLWFVELFGWLLYVIFELLMMLVQRRKPKKVPKPVIWRPTKNLR